MFDPAMKAPGEGALDPTFQGKRDLRGDNQTQRREAAPLARGTKAHQLLEATELSPTAKQILGNLTAHSIAHQQDLNALARSVTQHYNELGR